MTTRHPSNGPLGAGADQPCATAKFGEATEARDVLAAALRRAGIQLPALDVRGAGAVAPGAGRQARYALVQLGVCSAPVALALAAVIVKGAAR
ncbi:hypothetical protein [Streptomyces sp. RFCAC02]|uniref:hypothetical protein n=1 Tax=Streptomyces sp. RFCAC02 TaxID=2499143 RepID=UPI001021E4AB|nr:hypothetical protein [Streptomyces sp. RFCAC02]